MPAGNTSKANGNNYSAGCQIFTCDHKQFCSGGGGGEDEEGYDSKVTLV